MDLIIGLFCLTVSAGLFYQLQTYNTLKEGPKRCVHWVAVIINAALGVSNLVIYGYGLVGL